MLKISPEIECFHNFWSLLDTCCPNNHRQDNDNESYCEISHPRCLIAEVFGLRINQYDFKRLVKLIQQSGDCFCYL